MELGMTIFLILGICLALAGIVWMVFIIIDKTKNEDSSFTWMCIVSAALSILAGLAMTILALLIP